MRAAISSTALAAMKRAAGIADRASPAPRPLAAPRNALRRSVQRHGMGGAHGVQARDVARPRPVSALHQPADAPEDALLYQGGFGGLGVRARPPSKTEAPARLSHSWCGEARWCGTSASGSKETEYEDHGAACQLCCDKREDGAVRPGQYCCGNAREQS